MNIMKNGALFLFIILVLGLILASFLGGSFIKEGYTDVKTSKVQLNSGVTSATGSNGYDNYDHYSQSSTPTVYYGPNGGTASVTNDNGTFTIVVTGTNGKTTTYTTATSNSGSVSDSISSMMKQFSNNTFYGPKGGSARFFTGKDGQYAIEVTKANGDTTIYTATNTYTYNYEPSSSKSSTSTPGYNALPFASNSPQPTSLNSNGQYNSTMPKGIPKSMIPHGEEDLYILKSEVVPPVCPACPAATTIPRTEKCPPCPACARCPEPSFECKKVPNYNAANSESYLPVPVLNSFSTFGM